MKIKIIKTMKKDIITKFSDFKTKMNKDFDDKKGYNTLSDDISVLAKLDTGEYETVKGDVEIVQILDIVKNPEEIEKIEKAVKEGFFFDTSLTVNNVKRGDKIFLTVLLQKSKDAQTISNQNFGVICVRVVEIYSGISKLTSLMKTKK